jgi:ribosomal-protein-alanine N-acetyltransferase
MNNKLEFRKMELDDIDIIVELERLCFTLPWSRQSFIGELTQNKYAYYLVGLWEGRVVAYGGIWIVANEGHITNVAVHPEFRGRGIGEELMRGLLSLALEQNAESVSLEVRPSNTVAKSLYKKLGFAEVGLRKGYYFDNGEDAIIMRYDFYYRKGLIP